MLQKTRRISTYQVRARLATNNDQGRHLHKTPRKLLSWPFRGLLFELQEVHPICIYTLRHRRGGKLPIATFLTRRPLNCAGH